MGICLPNTPPVNAPQFNVRVRSIGIFVYLQNLRNLICVFIRHNAPWQNIARERYILINASAQRGGCEPKSSADVTQFRDTFVFSGRDEFLKYLSGARREIRATRSGPRLKPNRMPFFVWFPALLLTRVLCLFPVFPNSRVEPHPTRPLLVTVDAARLIIIIHIKYRKQSDTFYELFRWRKRQRTAASSRANDSDWRPEIWLPPVTNVRPRYLQTFSTADQPSIFGAFQWSRL